MATKAATKKAAAKKAPVRKASATKAKVASKAASTKAKTVRKAPAKKAAVHKPEPEANETNETNEPKVTKATKAQKRREERAAEKAAMREEIVRLRDQEGLSWTDIGNRVGCWAGKASEEYRAAQLAGKVEEMTPEGVVAARNEELMSWANIAIRFGTSIAKVQKAYAELAGDPHASYIGQGGRYFGHEDKVEEAKATVIAKRKSDRLAERVGTDPVFTGEETTAEIIEALSGKRIVWERPTDGMLDSARVHADGIKVGKQKGRRVVAFHEALKDGKNIWTAGPARTVHLDAIRKVGGR